jgi:hypothetical protein
MPSPKRWGGQQRRTKVDTEAAEWREEPIHDVALGGSYTTAEVEALVQKTSEVSHGSSPGRELT